MATTRISAAIQSIPAKKESLRKAFEVLQSSSSSLATFALEWKDIDSHFTSIEKSIQERFKDLQAKETEKSPALTKEEKPAPAPAAGEPEATPRPELKSLCVKMDSKGLRSFISSNRKDLNAIRSELNPALRLAPDPALLVLNAMGGFYPLKPVSEKDGAAQAIRRTCVNLLERVQVVAPEIKPSIREKAKELAMEWKGKISDTGGDNGLEAMGFLNLLISYGLASEFKADDLLDLLVLVSRRKQIIDHCKSLGLTENAPDLIQKLINKGKQLDAVRTAHAFNLLDKFPPVPLLRDYIKEAKKVAQEVRKKGKNSTQSQNEAIAKELSALKSVLKAVEEYKLESEYPRENLEKEIAQLEQQKLDKKRTAMETLEKRIAQLEQQKADKKRTWQKQQQQPQQSNKHPRLSISTLAPVVDAHPFPPLVQSQPWLGLTDRPPYMGMAGAGSYGSLYNHGGPNLSGTAMALGGNHSPTKSSLYPSSQSFAGAGGLYDRPATHSSYSLSGLPTSYSSSLYP